MATFLEKTASRLDNGLFVEATEHGGVISILAVNLKLRDERVSELRITLPAGTAAFTPEYRILDASHGDAYDGSASATLDLLDPPEVVGGTVTLLMQPRSVHLLQFDTTAAPVAPIPGTLLDSFDRGSAVRGLQLGQALSLTIGRIATGAATRGVAIGQAPPPPERVPVMGVAIALGNPTTTPTWTTIPASSLLKWEVTRGRNFELDRIDTGTCILTFDNRDRKWDPTYSGSILYPNLLPLRRMRLQATYNGVTRDVFHGYIERINMSQNGPNAGFAEVHLVDGFEVLANAVMKTPTPTFTFEDSGRLLLEAVGPYRGNLSVQITDTHSSEDQEFQATCIFDDSGVLTFNKRRSHSTGSWQSSLHTSDAVAALYANPRAAAIFKATVLTPGWVGTAPTGNFTSGWPQELAHVRIGRALDGIGWPSADRALDTSSYQVQAISFQDRNGVNAKAVADDAAGSELGLLYLDASGRVTFKRYQSRTSDSNSVTTQIVLTDSNDHDATEFGYQSLQHEYSRDKIYNDILVEVASQASGGPTGSGVGDVDEGDGYGAPPMGMVVGGGNKILGFPTGPPVQTVPKSGTASDATSQSKFYRRSLQISTSTANASLPQTLASELLRRYKDQHLRIASVTLSPSGQYGLWPHIIQRKIGDRALVKWTPPGGTAQIQVPSWIENIHISGGPGIENCVVEWGLSPVV